MSGICSTQSRLSQKESKFLLKKETKNNTPNNIPHPSDEWVTIPLDGEKNPLNGKASSSSNPSLCRNIFACCFLCHKESTHDALP